MQVWVLVGQLFAFNLCPNHEGIHWSANASLFDALQCWRAWRTHFGSVRLSLHNAVIGGAKFVLVCAHVGAAVDSADGAAVPLLVVHQHVLVLLLCQNRGRNNIRIAVLVHGRLQRGIGRQQGG